jgi:glycosyltransferase involved in cell wall biosynthesis
VNIAQVAPPWISVPPRGYGGTEWVVQQLCDGLTARGHQVTLYASGDSQTAAELRFLFPSQIPDVMGQTAFDARHVTFALADIVSRRGERTFDLVHDHSGFLLVAFAAQFDLPPVLHTIHCAFDRTAYGFYEQFATAVGYNAISNYQRRLAPPDMDWLGVVHNAIDLQKWAFHPQKRDYLLAFGRVCEAKGFHLAIQVARRTGRRLVMAGALQAQYAGYFHEQVEPELDDQIVYLGEVGDEQRRQLFAGAAGFLFPIVWPEPFGLVMIEALASGTPVIALRDGSVPEVIEHGRTGFIVDCVDEMVAAVDRLVEIDAAACRQAVEARFTVDRLVDEYEAIYRRLVGRA